MKLRQCHDFRQDHRQFGFSLESHTVAKITFPSVWNINITSQKIERGENKATKAFITNSCQNLSFEGVQSSNCGKLVCACVYIFA